MPGFLHVCTFCGVVTLLEMCIDVRFTQRDSGFAEIILLYVDELKCPQSFSPLLGLLYHNK